MVRILQYVAIIGDIVGSRQLPDRKPIQQKFLQVTQSANQLFEKDIESPLTVTIGDECQVLLNNPAMTLELIHYVQREMKPIQFVFGVGIGAITTDINKQLAIGMDGPAFYFARKALEKAKKKKPSLIFNADVAAIEMVNALLYFIESCSKRRTNRQKQVIQLFLQGLTQEQIAVQLGVTQETISEIISLSYHWEIQEAYAVIQRFLNGINPSDC